MSVEVSDQAPRHSVILRTVLPLLFTYSKLNGTVTGHTAEDKALCIVAAELGLPISAGQVEYAVFKGHCE